MKKSFITDQLDMDFEKSVYEIKKNGFKYIEIHSLWNKTVEDLDYDEIKRVKKIISKNANLEPKSIINKIYNNFLDFKGNMPIKDDLTSLLIKRSD